MAVTSGRVESNVGGNWSKFYVNWQQASQSIANNKTTINWQSGLYTGTSSSHDYWYSNAVKITNITINGQTVSNGGTWSNIKTGEDNQLLTGSLDIPHNNDGTKTFSISITGWLYGDGNKTGSGSFTLTNIPRQTSITSFSVSKRDETSVVYSYTTSDACDWAWYSTDNGSTWNTLPNSNIITGLSPNTSYNFKLRVRRTDSQMTTDSGTVTQSTYSIPTQSLKSKTETSITMNWNIDSTANYVWYSKDNGANWTAVGAVNSTSGSYTISGLTANQTYNIRTRVRRSGSGTYYSSGTANLAVQTYQYPYVDAVGTTNLTIGNSQTLTLKNPLSRSVTVYMKKDSTSGTQLYSGTTTGTSITFTPTASTLYNSIPNNTQANCVYYCTYSSQAVQTKSGTYKIDNSQGQQNPIFSTSNWTYTANQTSLTNNNKAVINKNSTVTFSISSAATAKNGASISSYKFEWGDKNISSTSGYSIANGNGNVLKATAIDSRGYQTSTTIDLGNNFIDYTSITGTAATQRQDGVEANTNLDISGNLFHQKFSSSGVQNEFVTAKYWISTSSTYSGDGYSIPVSNFTYSNNYYYLNDYIIHANGSSGGFTVGIRYNIKIELTDKITTTTIYTTVTDGKIAEDTYQDSNGNYHRGINGLADSNYTLTVHGNTFSDGQVFRNTGSSWIKDRDAAVVRNNNTTQDGNYYPVISQKTKDGNWTIGQLSGENNLTFNYTTDTNYNNNNNVSSRWTLSNSGLFSGKAATAGTADTATSATKATQDSAGSNLITTYTHAGAKSGSSTAVGSGGILQRSGLYTFDDGTWYNLINLRHRNGESDGTNFGMQLLSVLTNLNSSLRMRKQANGNWSSWEDIWRCKNLYNNAAGTTGTVTLSESAANFTYLDIYYGKSTTTRHFVRVCVSLDMSNICLISGYRYSSVYQLQFPTVKISETSITKSVNGAFNLQNGSSGGITNNEISIFRVDGYR